MNAGKLAAPILLMAMLMTSLMAIAIRNVCPAHMVGTFGFLLKLF